MKCSSSMCNRFFGSGSSSNNCFSGSSKGDRWCATKCSSVDDYSVYPHRERHELVRRSCGVHRIPFFTLSSTFYSAVLRNVPDNETPPIYGVDEMTLLPTIVNGATDIAYAVGVTGAVQEYVNGAYVNVDSHVHVQIPRGSSEGIVIDLNELSTFANSIYLNQTSETRNALLPGSGRHLAEGAVGGLPPTVANIADGLTAGFETFPVVIAGGTGIQGLFDNEDLGYDSARLMHVPEVTVYNASRHNVYVVDGFGGKCSGRSGCGPNASAASRRKSAKFEGVINRIGCKPREALCLVYLPDKCEWRVKDSNARA